MTRAAEWEQLVTPVTPQDLPKTLFEDVSEEIKEALIPHCKWFWAEKGCQLYGHTSEQNEFLYFVTKGKIKSEYFAADGKKYLLSYFVPGEPGEPGGHDIFGEMENLNKGPFNAGNPSYHHAYQNAAILTAVEDSEVIRIRYQDFREYGLKRDAALTLTENFLGFLANRIWVKLMETVVVRVQPAEEKLKERLRELYDDPSRPSKGTKGNRNVIHVKLAALLQGTGLSRSRFYQLKAEFQDKFTFDARKGELVILQPKWLEEGV